ncbi:MAG: ATP-binding protein [Sulfuricellaceae bacterium]|jgi:chemotaxis family two-component system sensor kinase Cph1
MQNEERQALSPIVRNAVLLALAWTLLVAASLGWNMANKRGEILHLARHEALTSINKDISFRYWVAAHGGVYVPPDAQTPPNPYLKAQERDVVTTSGKALTLMNPAYVTRQIHENYSSRFGIEGHMTSLKPVNPRNAPQNEWEIQALHSFERGAKEAVNTFESGGERYMRVMVPLVAEKPCLKCHAEQGYKEGDIRGGLAATVALSPYFSAGRPYLAMELSHGGIWAVGLLAIGLFTRRTLCRTRQRLAAERELAESYKLLQTITDLATEWAYWRNPDGGFRYVSPASTRVTGYSPEELYAAPQLLLEMVVPEDRERWLHHVHQADADGWPMPMELRILTKDGELRWISHVCRPIYDEDGRFLGVRGSHNDITDRHDREQIMIQQSRLAAMGEMIGNIAHQWRQPLNALEILLANLKDAFEYHELDQEAIDHTVLDGHHIIQRMSATIDDFRNFFKPNKEKARFNPRQTLDDTVSILKAGLRNNGITLHIEGDDELACYGYPNEYAQVLLNLLTNAKDAIVARKVPDGTIRLSLTRQDGQAVLTVRDNGGGIPEDILDKIFEPYFTTKEKGTGIGLYMSKTIIENSMGGQIAARNVAGGAEFTVRVPLDGEDGGNAPLAS